MNDFNQLFSFGIHKTPWDYRFKISNFKDFLKLVNGVLIDSEYPLSGSFIWLPYGNKVKELVFNSLTEKVHNYGYDLYTLPVIVPNKLLQHQSKLRSFEQDVYYVHSRLNKNSPVPYLRPDGITQINYLLSSWLKKAKDLPFRMYNVGPIFRVGGRIPLISGTGATMIEGYSALSTYKDAMAESMRIRSLIEEIAQSTYLPGFFVKRPPQGNYHELFCESFGFDVPLPTGKTIQPLSQYYHGTKYSNVFNVKVENEYVHLCSWGFSDRIIATMLINLADKKGLVLPPEFSPICCVILSLTQSAVSLAKEIYEELQRAKIPSWLDITNDHIVKRYLKYERVGIPIRIDLGDREAKNKTVTIIPRVGDKIEISKEYLITSLNSVVKNMQKNLSLIVDKKKLNSINTITSLQEKIDSSFTIKAIGLCSSSACINKVKEIFSGEINGWDVNKGNCTCIVCKKQGMLAYLARRH